MKNSEFRRPTQRPRRQRTVRSIADRLGNTVLTFVVWLKLSYYQPIVSLGWDSPGDNSKSRPPYWHENANACSKLDFDDPRAFASVSDRQLSRVQIPMFAVLSSRLNSKWIRNAVSTILRMKKGFCYYLFGWIPYQFLTGMLGITVFNHFCGGQTIDDCMERTTSLAEDGISTILDYAKENGEESTLDEAFYEVLKVLFKAQSNIAISFAVFKLSAIAQRSLLERISNGAANEDEIERFDLVRSRVDCLCNTACFLGVRLLIDAEESWIQPAIDEIAEEMMVKYNNNDFVVYNTIQLYRHDRLEYLKCLHSRLESKNAKTALKLVRGAYMEQEIARANKNGDISPIHESKNQTDFAFDSALEYCIENIRSIAIFVGTHNHRSIEHLANLIDSNGIERDDQRVFCAQLLGMSDDISFALATSGYNVGKYVPYAKLNDAIPYLSRRASENKAISGQISRELLIRRRELARRRMSSKL